jgi:uncharacterized protein (DUF1330 family)
MSVYMIIDSTVNDREKYAQYIDQFSPSPIIAKHGGRYHVRGGEIRSYGTWKPDSNLPFRPDRRRYSCIRTSK